jgi:hypothetical protein
MAVVIQKGNRYWHAGRFRVDWEALDGAEVIAMNRASFNEEPDTPTEDAAFANILSWVSADRAAFLNRLNQRLAERFGTAWTEIRPVLMQWIKNHPTATAGEARTALDAAYPNLVFRAERLLTKLLTAYDPPFSTWVEFRDYVVANFGTIQED